MPPPSRSTATSTATSSNAGAAADRGPRLNFRLTKQTLYVERLDCFAVSLFGAQRGAAILRFARSRLFNAVTVLITVLSTIHFVIGALNIADFSAFFEAAFGQDVESVVANGSFVPLPGYDPIAVFTRIAGMNALLDTWSLLGFLLFGFQIVLMIVIFITLNVPAARRSLGSFNGLFQL